MTITPANIFEYKDYRKFLQVRFLELKKLNSKTSLESMARKVGISKTYLRYILAGKRHSTLDLVPKLAKAMRLERSEHQALIYMVCRDTCQDQEAHSFFKDVLANLAHPVFKGDLKELFDRDNSQPVFKTSLAMVIHSLSKQKGFRPEVNWIRHRLNADHFTNDEIQSCVNRLVKTQSIVQSDDGRWKPAAFAYGTPGTSALDGYRVYQVGLKVMESVTETPERYKPITFQMMSLSFDDENLDQVVPLVHACRDSLIKLSQTTKDPSYVVFVSLNTACLAEARKFK